MSTSLPPVHESELQELEERLYRLRSEPTPNPNASWSRLRPLLSARPSRRGMWIRAALAAAAVFLAAGYVADIRPVRRGIDAVASTVAAVFGNTGAAPAADPGSEQPADGRSGANGDSPVAESDDRAADPAEDTEGAGGNATSDEGDKDNEPDASDEDDHAEEHEENDEAERERDLEKKVPAEDDASVEKDEKEEESEEKLD